ncbi:transposase [Sciscionella marina]|uniref:transposase n=1 Tax=Sciscionella marina TaxID=508770 RepID=UPI0023E183A5|nr:transposase [Sciscionella marina]
MLLPRSHREFEPSCPQHGPQAPQTRWIDQPGSRHLVCDNLTIHKTPAINTWLAKHPRFHVHFTPTGSFWINQVERWFGYLTNQLIRRGVHKSVTALEKDVREWITTWNHDPKPFVRTKTAEEILNSLSKYMTMISGAGH